MVRTIAQGRAKRFLTPTVPLLLLGLLAPAFASAESEDSSADATVPWILAYLEEYSLVLDIAEEGGREFTATSLSAPKGEDRLVLVYEHSSYSDSKADAPDSRQRIHYPFELTDLNPETIVVREWTAPLSGSSFYIVLVSITAAKEFVDYSNIVEERLEDGSIDVTSSRGKARTLALGYFPSEEHARRLAKAAKSLIESSHPRTKAQA